MIQFRHHHRLGFTLIELSIVLVIAGLIIGGILVGRELIIASEVRGTLSQIEKYTAAVYTFSTKYDGLPGDITNATTFGFPARGQFSGEGDNNGVIEGVSANAAASSAGYWEATGETVMLWVDLSAAGFIDGSFTTASAFTLPGANLTAANLPSYFPVPKLGRGNYIMAMSMSGDNVFCIQNIASITTAGDISVSGNGNIPVVMAYNIDVKADDGLPEGGRVRNWGHAHNFLIDSVFGTAAHNGSSITCEDNDGIGGTTPHYSLGQNQGSGNNCELCFPF
jgi:prepilin-type N-terminal cleavage/methylation domain-containing protein